VRHRKCHSVQTFQLFDPFGTAQTAVDLIPFKNYSWSNMFMTGDGRTVGDGGRRWSRRICWRLSSLARKPRCPPRPSLPPPGAPSRGQARVCPHCMLKRPGSGLQHRRAAQAARTQPPPPAYIGDPAATLEAAVAHFASVRGGAAHLNCTLCQIAIRESTRLEQLARRLPYEQGPDETPQASPPSSSS
jgi:hypothetical protein